MNINDFNIHYIDNRKHSDLYERIIKESLEGVSINEGEIKLHTVFMEEDDDSVKASLVLINAAPSKINFESLDITLENKETEDAVRENCDLRFLGVVPSNTITPFELEFKKDDFMDLKGNIKDLKAAFNIGMKAHGSVIISTIEADDSVRFEDKVQAKMYLKSLETMKKDMISLKMFDQYVSEGNIVVPVLFLNSYDKDADVSGISLGFRDVLGKVSSVKKFEDNIKVKSKSSTLVELVFNKEELEESAEFYMNCKPVML